MNAGEWKRIQAARESLTTPAVEKEIKRLMAGEPGGKSELDLKAMDAVLTAVQDGETIAVIRRNAWRVLGGCLELECDRLQAEASDARTALQAERPCDPLEGGECERDGLKPFRDMRLIYDPVADLQSRVKGIGADLGSMAEIGRSRERRVDGLEDRIAALETRRSPNETDFVKALVRLEHLESWARMAPRGDDR